MLPLANRNLDATQLEESERYQTFLKKVGLDDAARDQVMQMVNEISHVTGIEVTLDEVQAT